MASTKTKQSLWELLKNLLPAIIVSILVKIIFDRTRLFVDLIYQLMILIGIIIIIGTLVYSVKREIPRTIWVGIIVLMIGTSILTVGLINIHPKTIKYDFERDAMCWMENKPGGEGFVYVRWTNMRTYNGLGALKMILDLDSTCINKSMGEIIADWRYFPPEGMKAPINMKDKTITCRIFAPHNSVGNVAWVQIFVKDWNMKSEYGVPTPVVEESWFPTSFTIGDLANFRNKNFNPNEIIMCGVKICVKGEDLNLNLSYKGPIYMDSFDWDC